MIFHRIYISSIQLHNLYLLVGFIYWLLGNRIWPVEQVRSYCNTSISKRCHGNDNVNVMLHLLSCDTYYMYLLSATEKKPTGPKLYMLW